MFKFKKIFDSSEETTLKDTVAAALKQIEKKQYKVLLKARESPLSESENMGLLLKEKTC